MSDRYHTWVFVIIGLALVTMALVTKGFPGEADAFNHFLISKRAFEHPDLFLDHWNKPLFTLVSAPFSQFGFTGIRLMNVLIGLFTSILIYLAARKDDVRLAIVAPFILLGMPQYLSFLPSAMTKPLFGLVVAGTVLALRTNKIGLAVLLIGISPFARQGGYIPFALVYLILLKKWKLIPVLFSGVIMIGLLT